MPLEAVPQITPFEAFAIMLVGGFFYFLPGFVAIFRYHHSVRAIFLFLVVLGWSGIGWLIALVWAMSGYPDADVKTMRRNARRRYESSQAEARRQEKQRRKAEKKRLKRYGNGAGQTPQPVAEPVQARAAGGGNGQVDLQDELRQIWGQVGANMAVAVQGAGQPVTEMREDLTRLIASRGAETPRKEGGNGADGGADHPAQSIWGTPQNVDEPDESADEDDRSGMAERQPMEPDDTAGSVATATKAEATESRAGSKAPTVEDDGPSAEPRRCRRCKEVVVPIDDCCPVCGANSV